jgi:adenylate kinase
MISKRSAVLLLGPPASGKTTITNAVDHQHGVATVRTGHLLRQSIKSNPDLGRQLQSHLEAGRLAPTHLVVQVIGNAIDSVHEPVLLFDGFPRLPDQIEPCFNLLNEHNLTLRAVLILLLSSDEIRRRLAGRRVCPKCGATYHVEAQPPQHEGRCDQCNTALVQRADDSPDAITERLDVYRRETLPVVEFFKSNHPNLVKEISVERSTDRACQILRDLVDEASNHD